MFVASKTKSGVYYTLSVIEDASSIPENYEVISPEVAEILRENMPCKLSGSSIIPSDTSELSVPFVEINPEPTDTEILNALLGVDM